MSCLFHPLVVYILLGSLYIHFYFILAPLPGERQKVLVYDRIKPQYLRIQPQPYSITGEIHIALVYDWIQKPLGFVKRVEHLILRLLMPTTSPLLYFRTLIPNQLVFSMTTTQYGVLRSLGPVTFTITSAEPTTYPKAITYLIRALEGSSLPYPLRLLRNRLPKPLLNHTAFYPLLLYLTYYAYFDQIERVSLRRGGPFHLEPWDSHLQPSS